MPVVGTLRSYPYVVVRISCDLCGRFGQYRLVRLGAEYGPDCPLEALLARLTETCWRRRAKRGRGQGCEARFIDLDSSHPPDLPPGGRPRLRVVGGSSGS
jgi:hypothetical protein